MPDFDDLDKLGNLDDLGDLGHISFDEPAAPARPPSGLGAVIQDLMARRNYQQVVQIASSQQDAVNRDPAVAALVASARAKLEQEAFIQSFLDGARRALGAGQIDQARQYYEKARSLDPHHPDLIAFARQAAGGAPAAPAAQAYQSPPPAYQPPPPAYSPPPPAYSPPAQAYSPPPPEAYSPPAYAPPDPGSTPTRSLSQDDQDDFLNFDEPSPFQVDPLSFGGGSPAKAAPGSAFGAPPAAAPADGFGDLSFDENSFAGFKSPGTEASFGGPAGAHGNAHGNAFGAEPSFAPAAPAHTFGTEPSFEGFESAFGSPPAPSGPSVYETGFSDPNLGQDGGGNRIRELLAEGQAHFDREEYQNAIDVWSRIFLIDIENQEASGRIEAARGKKAERERQAEELFHRAADQIEKGELEEAKVSLGQVLVLQPGHSSARDYLDQLNSGKVPTIRRDDPAAIDLLDDGGFGDLQKAAGVKEVGHTLEAAVARDRVVVVKRADRRLIAAAAAGAVVVIGAIFFLVTRWDSLFPNKEEAPAAAPRNIGAIDRAKKIFEQGKVENAIQLLEKVPQEDESYKEAQTLISQWKAMVKTGAPEEAGPSPEMAARRQRLVDAAREMSRQKQFLRSRKLLERAAKIQPLEGAEQALKQEADDHLEPITAEIAKFEEGSFEAILPQLWRLHDANPMDQDVLNLMLDSYYNLAVTDLQRGAPDLASQKLKEATGLQPDNDELVRLKLFAESYETRSQDLLYRIFVKYLPNRG